MAFPNCDSSVTTAKEDFSYPVKQTWSRCNDGRGRSIRSRVYSSVFTGLWYRRSACRFLQVSRTEDFTHDPTIKNPVWSDQANGWDMERHSLPIQRSRRRVNEMFKSAICKVRWGCDMLKSRTRRTKNRICSITREYVPWKHSVHCCN